MSWRIPATTLLVLACSTLAACRADLATSPTAATVPAPAPAPPAQQHATPAPFGLTQDRTFDILGWDSWPIAPTPSVIQFRWSAAIKKYEVLAPGFAYWSRLEARSDTTYDVFDSTGTKLPFEMPLSVSPLPSTYVGNARIFQGGVARAYFAFGLATEPGDVPVTGTMICGEGFAAVTGIMTGVCRR